MRFENQTQKKIDAYYNERLKKAIRQAKYSFIVCLAIILIVSVINL
jgi:hypothetical protein